MCAALKTRASCCGLSLSKVPSTQRVFSHLRDIYLPNLFISRYTLHTTHPLVTMVRVLSIATAASAMLLSASATKLYGVNYNIRTGADWEPEATKCKSADVIARELAQLKQITDNIRIYSLNDCNQADKVIPAATAAGLKVWLGLWVGPQPEVFEGEKAKLAELIANGAITQNTLAISVGSEALLRGDVNATVAIANAKAVKELCVENGVKAPITITDTTESYLKHPALVDAVDIVSPNIFPFWDRVEAAKGPDQLYRKLQLLAKIAKGKEVVIGETGWATDGSEAKASEATMANAATYFNGFVALAEKRKLRYFYFAGFDEAWKTQSGAENSSVEPFFGMFDKDGKLKAAYSSLTVTATPTIASASPATESALLSKGTTAPTPTSTPVVSTKASTPISGSTGSVSGGGVAQNDDSKTESTTPAVPASKKSKHKDCDA